MPSPAETEAAMAAALLDPAEPGPADARFAVHRNNVLVGLVDALGETFPAVRALVGEEFFRAAGAAFVRAHPPESPVLILWGGAFPDWIAAFPPAAGVPYLGDVARLEWAWTEAYNAAEATPLAAPALAAVPGERLPDMRLVLHPAVRLVASRFPVASLWADVTGRETGLRPELAQAETALVSRPYDVVSVRAIPTASAAFLSALAGGHTLGAAAAAGTAEPGFDLAAEITALFQAGLVAALATETPGVDHGPLG
ncbi:MAG: DUF2063 domain-containing protein [Rhodospirillales bacterium]|nr:MAG: DUF2063 domain-containing protein [Rhodospirillales bacterium]